MRVLELKVVDDGKMVTLRFEHSLLSVSKWESKHCKPFLDRGVIDTTELVDYFEEMLVTPSNKTLVYRLQPEQMKELTQYINRSCTASSVPTAEIKTRFGQEIVTSELIYYWMVAFRIPFEAEKWHLSRLMMLIQIANFKQQPEKKQNAARVMANWRELNAKRKAE